VHAATVVDGHLKWQEHPDPEPGSGELLIDVRAAGINNADLLQRKGLYPAPPGSPADVPGLELAGEVVGLGPGVNRFSTGDRVMAVVGGGGHAELAVVHERAVMPVPPGLSWSQAGGFPEAYTTAHDALFTQCGLAVGQHALVHAAAGGVGLAGVQLALEAGARVTATVRNPELRAGVAELGAGEAAGRPLEVTAHDDFADRGPFDVVLELIGGPNLASDLTTLAVGGHIVVIGVGGGSRAEVDLLALMAKRATIHASTLRARPLEQKAAAARLVEAHVLPAVASGRIQVPVAATLPFDEPDAAYDRFAAGGKLGKLVLLRA